MPRLRLLTLTAVGFGAVLATIGAPSQAAWWGGVADGGYPNVNQVYPEVSTLLRRPSARRVTVVNVQMFLACINPVDTESTLLAFDARSQSVRTHRGRFRTRVVTDSPDIRAVVRFGGRLRASGRGRLTVTVEGVRRSATGSNIGSCEGDASFLLTRGRSVG
jgi:hypothetical protein